MVNQYARRWVIAFSVCAAASHVATTAPGQQRSGQPRVAQQQRFAQQPRVAQQQAGPQQFPQQQNGQQPLGPQAAPRAQAALPQAAANVPDWMPLAPALEDHLNKVLNFWEFKTSKIERYRCNFKRYEYEMKRRNGAGNQPIWEFVNKTYTEGKIQYEAPDKGLFEAELIKHRTPPQEPGGPAGWQLQTDGHREHWVCDGQSVFEFNHSQKQLIVRPLPPGMKGKQIAEGPLPFMFGAKADQIKNRFWVHVITPPEAQKKKEFHLEAVPKTLQDAQNFRMLHIIIDGNDFLPKAMVLFHRNNAKTTFLFEDREVNWSTTLAELTGFRRKFFEPALPGRDWKKVVVPLNPAVNAARPQAPQNVTSRPAFGPLRQAQTPRRQQPRR